MKLNALRSTTPEASDAATPQRYKAALRKQVEQAFDVRQQLQELEAQKLRLKLQLIEANLTTRQKNRDGIIERRVEELLDPNAEVTEWDSSRGSRLSGGGIPVMSELVDLPGPPSLPKGQAEAGRPFQKDSTQPAATLPAYVHDTAAAMTWKQPSGIISELRIGQRLTARLHEQMSEAEEKIRSLSETKNRETSSSDLRARIESEIRILEQNKAGYTAVRKESMRDWPQAWSEYQSQLRLLRLDVEAAKASLAPLIGKLDRVKQLVEKGVASKFETDEAESQVQLAEIQLRRAEELLKLYTDIETNEPKLNPDYQAPPAETATDAKTE